ncbi:type II secretion system protein [bacterium]|nr:MAG: type II secretion system protein [bacterium]
MSRGFTLIEAVVGMAVLALIALGVAGIFKAGMQASNYTLRQTFVVSNARKALLGDGPRKGLVWDLRESEAVTSLSAGSVSATAPGSSTLSYALGNDALARTHSGVSKEVAKGVTGLGAAYFNFDDAGRVIESTTPASAMLATTEVVLSRRGQREYRFLSGARLRNHNP